MNVYAITADGTYGAGMAIVVADSEEQAKSLASTLSCANWYVRYDAPEKVEILPCVCGGTARVLTHFENGD